MDLTAIDRMESKAPAAAAFLKGLASPQRLMILCRLSQGEVCVSDLIEATGIPPTSMSQHLGKLKEEGIVAVRRDHRTLFYRIDHPATLAVMGVLYDYFCKEPTSE